MAAKTVWQPLTFAAPFEDRHSPPEAGRVNYGQDTMNIELKKITIRELVKGYADDPACGVSGHGARLDICPECQQKFVYKE